LPSVQQRIDKRSQQRSTQHAKPMQKPGGTGLKDRRFPVDDFNLVHLSILKWMVWPDQRGARIIHPYSILKAGTGFLPAWFLSIPTLAPADPFHTLDPGLA
jgi:hypothetical protein